MKLDFDTVEQNSDFVTVPAGTYLCKIAEVQTGTTRYGDERWGVRLIVAEGEYVGRQAAWDSLVFSSRGMARVQQVLRALKLPASGTVDLAPEDLKDRAVFVEVRPTEYQPPGSERTIRRNEVPYSGYSEVPDGEDGGPPDLTPTPPPPAAPDLSSLPF